MHDADHQITATGSDAARHPLASLSYLKATTRLIRASRDRRARQGHGEGNVVEDVCARCSRLLPSSDDRKRVPHHDNTAKL